MKIMYCITSSSWGGAQLHVLELCKDQVKRGNEVIFVVGNRGPLLEKMKTVNGVRVILLSSLKREISPINDIRSIYRLRKLLKKERPDILHLHSSKAGTIGRLAAIGLRDKIKVIFTVHGWAFTDGVPSETKRFIYRNVERIVSPLTSLFICVSEYDREIGIRDKVLKKASNAVVIHNGSPVPRSSAINFSIHKPIRLVMTARFSNQKNQKLLIETVNELDKKIWHLTFVGDGVTLESCKAYVNKLNLNSNIDFIGFKSDVTPYLIENDVYILTSFYEGLPISIIEAMSYGLPIIANDVGGNSELVKNGINGFLINSKDDLKKAILTFINTPEKIKVMGKASFGLYKRSLTLKHNMEEINDVYEKLYRNSKLNPES